VSAGAAFLHACQDKALTTLKHIPLTGSEEEMLSELTETILPKTDFIGAKDLKSADFVFMMADDCLSPEDQAKFSAGMKAFDEVCKSKMGSRFVKLPVEKRNEFLSMIEADKKGQDVGVELRWFYGQVRQGTIQNFTSSKEYLSQVRNITTLIPGKFKACVPVVNA
jgi:hypothetical protein